MMSCSPDNQVCIDSNKLFQFIMLLKEKYPDKEIHVIGKGNIIPPIAKIFQHFKVITHSNNDPDLDLWLLINSDVLVLSKSNFAIVSGFYHQGSQVYYPLWGTGVSSGVNSKYDKSGWIAYV